MTSDKQEINRIIAEAMGWDFSWYDPSGIHYDKGIYLNSDGTVAKFHFNPTDSIADVMEAMDKIASSNINVHLSLYINLNGIDKYIADINADFNGAWEGRSNESLSEAISLALYEQIKKK